MSAKIIALANQKGGVTKTTSTFNIAAGLALKGYKTVMIDFDPQASLTISAGYEPLDFQYTISDVLKGDAITQAIYKVDHVSENLYIIPSIIDLAKTEVELVGRTARESVLKKKLEEIEDQFEYIIIDCPPQLALLTINALTACTDLIIPCQTNYLAYRGLKELIHTIEELKELLECKINIIGVIATLYDKRTKKDKEILEVLEEEYKVLGTVKKTVKAIEGIYEGKPIIQMDSKCEVAKAYLKIVDDIITL